MRSQIKEGKLVLGLCASLVYEVRRRLGPRPHELALRRGRARSMTLATHSQPFSRRQCRSADLASLNTMASAFRHDRQTPGLVGPQPDGGEGAGLAADYSKSDLKRAMSHRGQHERDLRQAAALT